MIRLIVYLTHKKFEFELQSQKQIDDFYIALTDSTKFVKFGQLIFAKSEFRYAIIEYLAQV